MKKLILPIILLIATNVKAQWYYGAETGIYAGANKVLNKDLNVTERVKYGSFFFNAPIGIKNAYNVLFESNIGYAGNITTGLNVGYQFGSDKTANLQVLGGVADFIEPRKHLKFTNSFSYNAIGRFNVGHFFLQVHYSDKTTFIGLGMKAFIYE